jgi:hypothetical protein
MGCDTETSRSIGPSTDSSHLSVRFGHRAEKHFELMESLGSSTLTKTLRLSLLLISAFISAGFEGSARGQGVSDAPPVLGTTELFQSDSTSGLALGGYDPVTYFLPEGPRPGRPDFELLWGGVAWRFASEANRAAFENDPGTFAPRIGGYDAEAAARGRLVDARADLFVVRDNRLYLFRNDGNRALFLADESLAPLSENRWAQLTTRLVKP